MKKFIICALVSSLFVFGCKSKSTEPVFEATVPASPTEATVPADAQATVELAKEAEVKAAADAVTTETGTAVTATPVTNQ